MTNLDRVEIEYEQKAQQVYGDLVRETVLETEIVQCPSCDETFGYNPATQTDIFCPFCDKKMRILAC